MKTKVLQFLIVKQSFANRVVDRTGAVGEERKTLGPIRNVGFFGRWLRVCVFFF